MKRTKLQNSIIHAQRHKCGISDEYYRTLIFNLSNGRTESSADLSVAEADRLIKELGVTPPPRGNGVSRRTQQRRNKAAGVTVLASPAQRQTLIEMARARWGATHIEPLRKLCQRMFRRNEPHTSKQASALIEAIKQMNARNNAKEAA